MNAPYEYDEGYIYYWQVPKWLVIICIVSGVGAFAMSMDIMAYLSKLEMSHIVKLYDAPIGKAIALGVVSLFSTAAGVACAICFIGGLVTGIKNFFLSNFNTTYKFKKQ